MKTNFSGVGRWAVRILCVLALVLVGFDSQRSPTGPGELTPAELAQYRLPDGTLPIVCITYQDEDGNTRGKVHVPACYACQIATAVLLPAAPIVDSGHLPFLVASFVAPRREVFHRRLYPPNTGPRAPPQPPTVA